MSANKATLGSPTRLPHRWGRLGDVPLDRYGLHVDGVEVGHIVLAQHAGWAHVGYVHVDSAHRGKGYGVLLHEVAAMAIKGMLAVEHACSPDEGFILDSLERRGWLKFTVPDMVYPPSGSGVWGMVPPCLRQLVEARLARRSDLVRFEVES